jgi:hypothetical protein
MMLAVVRPSQSPWIETTSLSWNTLASRIPPAVLSGWLESSQGLAVGEGMIAPVREDLRSVAQFESSSMAEAGDHLRQSANVMELLDTFVN